MAETSDVVNSFLAYTYERQESASDRETDDPAAAATRPEVPHCFHLPRERDSSVYNNKISPRVVVVKCFVLLLCLCCCILL